MDFSAFLWSLLFGFLLVIPAGPIALLVIQRSIQCDTKSGIFTGLGSAISDLIYVLIAGFGVIFVSEFIDQYELEFGIIGVLTVLIFGIKIIFDKPAIPQKIAIDENLFVDSVSGFLLAIINVANILIFSALFIYLQQFQTTSRALFVAECALGIFIGTMIWWSLLSYFVNSIKNKISDKGFILFHRFSGWFMVAFSLFLFFQVITS